MGWRIAADAVLLLHLAFVLFVTAGALVVLRFPRAAWLHVPAVVWGAYIELSGRLCPLTTVENRFRRAAGEAGYDGGFIEQYIFPIVYPPGLTRSAQTWIAAAVILINVIAYGYLACRRRSRSRD